MIDFKKALTSFYSGIKWYYLLFILILASLSVISEIMMFISVMLTVIFSIIFVGLKFNNKLKTIKQTYKPILKNTFIFIIVSIIFVITQVIIFILGMLPYLLIAKDPNILFNPAEFEVLLYTTPSWLVILCAIILLIAIFVVFCLEIFKIFGMLRYFKTNDFEKIFDIKENIKLLFSMDYLTILIYTIGVIFTGTFIFAILVFIIELIFSISVGNAISGVIFILIFSIINMIHYSLANDLTYNKK